jgi:low affinity Fe/Cu permease
MRTPAVVIAGVYEAAWFTFGDLNWHAVATLATWLMTLVIQRAEYRDTQAIHAKLDELLRVDKEVRSELTGLDHEEPEDIEKRRTLGARRRRAA